jgi:uridine kinase
MIYLIAGASHTGKTAYAQRLLEKYHHLVLLLKLYILKHLVL